MLSLAYLLSLSTFKLIFFKEEMIKNEEADEL